LDLRAQLQAHLGTAFVLERELGGGGMSRVFVANEVRLSRKVVVKVLSPELAQGLNAERFEREILLAASLQQANIVPVLAAGDIDGLPYFTMPFVEGESLRSRLGGSGLPIPDVVAILRDVTKALAYAHARNIVHRDIKPDNVLLSGGTAVVTDFGIAKALSASRTAGTGATLTSIGTSIGTPAYMAPEQVAGDPNLDHRVDLYALGCMAQELLTGRAPFADRTPQKMLAAHLSESAISVSALRPDCPPGLASLVSQLLRKDPADRPASASDVLRALDAIGTSSNPTLALSAPGALPKVLGLYVAATAAVAILAKAAVVGIGLPDWVFPGAVLIMLLGLPALLITAYIKRVARHAVTATPTLTPGGTLAARPPSGTMATMALKASPHVSWRRTARGGMIAMGAFVLLVVGVMASRAMGVGPWASLVSAGKLGAEDRIVLAELKASPEDSSLAPIINEAIRAAMSQSRAVHLVPQIEVAGALEQMRRPAETRLVDADVVNQVAARTNARAILGGRLARAGSDAFAISLDLMATSSGAVLASYQATTTTSDLLKTVDRLSRQLRGRVGESLRQVQRTIPLERATTTSLDALRKYSEAVIANDIESDYPRAVRAAREAVALDSTFALAWRKLAVALFNTAAPVLAQDSAIRRAAQYADRLPDRERYMIIGKYYEGGSAAADRGAALAAYNRVYQADSANTTALNELTLLYLMRGLPDSALRFARRYALAVPQPASIERLAGAYANAGKYDSAQRLIDSLLKASPASAEDLNALVARVGLQYGRNQRDSVRATLGAMQHSMNVAVRQFAFQSGLETSLMEGALKRAAAADSQLDAILAAQHAPTSLGTVAAVRDIMYRGRPNEGLRRLDSITAGSAWAATSPADRPYLLMVTLYARAGRPDQARTLLAQYVATPFARAPDSQPELHFAEAEIALAEGKTADAVRLYHDAERLKDGGPALCAGCAPYGLAHAFDRMGQADSAIAYFERYLAIPPSIRGVSLGASDGMYLPAIEKRLAELYDAKNDRTRAMQHYGAFVDLWKNADAELQPTVASVKKRMTELVAEKQ
jgi:tetratricopeptide (TPR) repeat protein